MSILNSFAGLVRYRYKLYYAVIKSSINSGSFIYKVKDNVRFVCNKNDAFSKVIFISNGHEKVEMNWCMHWMDSAKGNSTIIDCGSNIGYFSSYLAQIFPNSTYKAIEGNKNTFNILVDNIKKLELKNIAAVHAVLAESNDKNYYIPDVPGREPWQQAKIDLGSGVRSQTLDKIVDDGNLIPDLVKIDCEGFEVKILKGASKLLKTRSTVFMIECNDPALNEAGTSRIELFEIFRRNNFKLFHLASFDLRLPVGLEIEDSFPSKEFNFVAIPNKSVFINRWQNTLKFFN